MARGHVRVDIDGIDEAQDFLNKVEQSAKAIAKARLLVGATEPYGYKIETGRAKRSGRLGRAAGGVFFLTGALQSLGPKVDEELAEAMEKGPAESQKTLRDIGRKLEAEAIRRETAVVTGNLRRSLHAYGEGITGLSRP